VRHARHALKVLIKYHLMEEREQGLEELLRWAEGTPMLGQLWDRHGRAGGGSARGWCEGAVRDLVKAGVVGVREGVVVDL